MKITVENANGYNILVDGRRGGGVSESFCHEGWWAFATDAVGNIYGLGDFATKAEAVRAVKKWHTKPKRLKEAKP